MAKKQTTVKKQTSEDKYLIDQTAPRADAKTGEVATYWRVYYWDERPDKAQYTADDQFHWHPDSEHPTEAAAKERVAALKAGAKRRSLFALGYKH